MPVMLTFQLVFRKISFHLQFCCNSSDFIDQGVRFEYDDTTTDRRWQPIKFYTTTVNEHENGTVFLNADGKSVTASAERYDSTLPLQIVNSSQLIRVSEFLCGFNYSSSDIRLRWMQRYTSVTPQLGIATWSLDNITVTIWNGSCKWTSFKETFENESNRRFASVCNAVIAIIIIIIIIIIVFAVLFFMGALYKAKIIIYFILINFHLTLLEDPLL